MMSQLAEEMAAAKERERKAAQAEFINQILQAPEAKNQSKREMLGLTKKRTIPEPPAPLFAGKSLFEAAAAIETSAPPPKPQPPTSWTAPEVRWYQASQEQLDADRQAREAAGFDPIAAMRQIRKSRKSRHNK